MNKSSIDEFEKEYGKAFEFVPSGNASKAPENANLPKRLFTYWERFGFSTFLDGYFQILNPADYQGAVDTWLEDTHLGALDEYRAISMDCFGKINLWGKQTGSRFHINIGYHSIFDSEPENQERLEEKFKDAFIESLLFVELPEEVTPESESLVARRFFAAKEKLGPLKPNQIYAPVPAIPLGGQMRLEDLQIVEAPEYLAMVAELTPVRVMTRADLLRIAFGDGAENTLKGLLKDS